MYLSIQPLPFPATVRPPAVPSRNPEELQSNALPSPLTLEALGDSSGFDPQEISCATEPNPQLVNAESVLLFQGGETAALRRVQDYIWDLDLLKSYKDTRT